MEIFCCNRIRCRSLLLPAAVLITMLTACWVLAENVPPAGKSSEAGNKIYITSDSMISDNNTKYAEFIGNVKAIQEGNTIVADRLKIFFRKDMKNTGNLAADQDSISKIVANGNVVIHFDNKVAVAEQAVYFTDTKIMVLSGKDSKITSGNDSISGEKITLYRKNGKINVESGSDKRVNAVIRSGKKGLN